MELKVARKLFKRLLAIYHRKNMQTYFKKLKKKSRQIFGGISITGAREISGFIGYQIIQLVI